jgi:AcrR family transcriptional regulator
LWRQKIKVKKDTSTEDKIREAARQVFLAKGFDGCTSREIANAAGENVALVNYYFRSKSQLFKIIFEAAMDDFILSMVQVFGSDKTLEEKMRIFIEHEYAFLEKHPELPSFILNEMNREEGCTMDHQKYFLKVAETGIFEECFKAQKEGRMRSISLSSIPLLIMSNCHYPVMAKNMLMQLHGMTSTEYDDNLNLHKKLVSDMLVNFLFPQSN